MSKPIVLRYDAPVSNYVANAQDVAVGAPLILNGSSPYAPIPTGPIVFNQLQRPITLTSTTVTSNAGVTFVIVGTQLGSPAIVTENLVGPTGSGGLTPTVTSINQYHTIISITATVAAATGISAGTGIGAQFDWQTMDVYRTFAQYSIQGVVGGAGGAVSYTVLQTLDDPQNPPSSISAFAVDDSIDTPLTASTFYSFSYPISGLQLYVGSATDGTNATGTLVFTIFQQGVK